MRLLIAPRAASLTFLSKVLHFLYSNELRPDLDKEVLTEVRSGVFCDC